jgi:hypothetical protein
MKAEELHDDFERKIEAELSKIILKVNRKMNAKAASPAVNAAKKTKAKSGRPIKRS